MNRGSEERPGTTNTGSSTACAVLGESVRFRLEPSSTCGRRIKIHPVTGTAPQPSTTYTKTATGCQPDSFSTSGLQILTLGPELPAATFVEVVGTGPR